MIVSNANQQWTSEDYEEKILRLTDRINMFNDCTEQIVSFSQDLHIAGNEHLLAWVSKLEGIAALNAKDRL